MDTNTVLDAQVITETVEAPVVDEAPVAEDAVETPVEETAEAVETPAETPAETVEAPVTFDTTLDATQLIEAGKETLDQWELPQPIQAYIEALQTKATTETVNPYTAYGTEEDVKTVLDRQNMLLSARETERPGQFRPNTDKFVETLPSDTKQYLYFDLAATPSSKYTGHTLFEEAIIDNLSLPTDTSTVQVLDRYKAVVKSMQSGALPSTGMPQFIPAELADAYWQMPKEMRENIEYLDPETDVGGQIQETLQYLERSQAGINAAKQLQNSEQQTIAEAREQFAIDVVAAAETFYDQIRTDFVADLAANVQFHTDPKLNSLLAGQQVTLLSEAFVDGAEGVFARKTLQDASIEFDFNKAQQLTKALETATVELTRARRMVKPDGTHADPVAINKAMSKLDAITRDFKAFGKTIIDQEARLVSTGTAEAITKEAEKIKIPPKARVTPKGSQTTATQSKMLEPPPEIKYGSLEWDSWWAKQAINEREAKRAASYR